MLLYLLDVKRKNIVQRNNLFFSFQWLLEGNPNKRAEQLNSIKKRAGGVFNKKQNKK